MNPEPGHQNPMDLLTDAGFVILGKICVYVIFAMFYFWGKKRIATEWIQKFYIGYFGTEQGCPSYYFPFNILRTALVVMMRGDYEQGWLAHFGLKCSSWTVVNAGTSGRSACSSIGNTDFQSVREGNCLGSRIFVVVKDPFLVAPCLI